MSPGEAPPRDPRLFSASTATGSFKVEEVDLPLANINGINTISSSPCLFVLRLIISTNLI